MKRLKIALLAVLTAIFPVSAFVQLNLIDTPAPDTLLRGYYHIYFSSYENGGIKLKVGIGLLDWMTLGISEDVGNAIGDANVKPNIPGVMARFAIFRPDDGKLGWAAGWDNFIEGDYGKFTWTETNNATKETGTFTEIIYGVYSSFAVPFKLLNGDHRFNFGVRYPLLPVKMPKTINDISFFAGFDIGLSKEFHLSTELENVTLSLVNSPRAMLNASVKYVVGDVLGVSLVFRYLFSNPNKNPSRSIIIEYQNLFY
jgi:hypothetical protein